MRMKHGKVKFGYKDSWGQEGLQEIIHDWLVNFKDTLVKVRSEDGCVGIPATLLPDEVQDGSQLLGSGDSFENNLKEWFGIIDEMIYAFNDYEVEYKGGFHEGENHGKVTGEGATRFTQWNMEISDKDAWEAYMKEREEVYERKKKGRELFAEHFNDLWW